MKNKFCVVHFSIFIFSGKLKNELSFCSIFHLFVKIGKWKISRNSFFIFLKNKVSVYTCFQNHVIHAFRAIRGTCCHFVFRLVSLVRKTHWLFISYFPFSIVQSIFDNFILCFLLFFSFLFIKYPYSFFLVPLYPFLYSFFNFSFIYFSFFFFLFSFFLFSLFLFLFLYTVFLFTFFFISYSFFYFLNFFFISFSFLSFFLNTFFFLPFNFNFLFSVSLIFSFSFRFASMAIMGTNYGLQGMLGYIVRCQCTNLARHFEMNLVEEDDIRSLVWAGNNTCRNRFLVAGTFFYGEKGLERKECLGILPCDEGFTSLSFVSWTT